MTNLPPHLQKLVDKIEQQEKQFGIVPMHKILKAQAENMENDSFHILHAFAQF